MAVVWSLLPLAAGVFGFFAYSADPLLVSLAFLLILGGGFLSKPVWILNILLVFGMLMTGPINLFLESLADKALWGSSILGLTLLGLAVFKLLTQRNLQQDTPKFVWLALIFMGYVLLESALQINTLKEFIGGFKRYFQVWGVLFALCWLGFGRKDVACWRWIFLLAGILQLPFALYELVRLVPLRQSAQAYLPTLVPIDIVAGTFAGKLYGGGGSAEMSTFLVVIFAFLLARFKEQQLAKTDFIRFSALILAPLFIGEAKIMVVFLPLACAVIYQRELLTRPLYLLAAMVLGGLFLTAMISVLMAVTQQSFDKLVWQTLAYNFMEAGYGSFHLNRTTVLTFWASQQSWQDPFLFAFGCGLGCAKMSTSIDMPNGIMEARFPHYGIGLTSVSLLLWEVGVVGFGLLLWSFASAWRSAVRLSKLGDPLLKADALGIQAVLALFTVYLFYLDSLFSMVSFQLVLLGTLGYLAWLCRRSYQR